MTDALGYRKEMGVLVPSTNTIVEPETYMMSVPGVTAHTARIHIYNKDLSSDAANLRFLANVEAEYKGAIERVVTCEPDYIVMGLSAPTFFGGKKGSLDLKRRLSTWAGGIKVAIGSEACERALHAFGVKRIAILSPYQANGDVEVRRFFSECGFEVVKLMGLRVPTAIAIAHITEDTVRKNLMEVNSSDAEALVQVGTNLACVRVAEEAERWLNKPVIAINAATWWMALRECGINDQVYGCGRILREF